MASITTPTSKPPRMRLLTVLLALAAYLLAFAAATAGSSASNPNLERRQLMGGLPFDVADLLPGGRGGGRSSSSSSSPDLEETGSSSRAAGVSRQYQCSSGTPAGTMWINSLSDDAYTCAPVAGRSGKNYCVRTSMQELGSAASLCSSHADCGTGAWCILVSGESKACWHLASGCNDYSNGDGLELKQKM